MVGGEREEWMEGAGMAGEGRVEGREAAHAASSLPKTPNLWESEAVRLLCRPLQAAGAPPIPPASATLHTASSPPPSPHLWQSEAVLLVCRLLQAAQCTPSPPPALPPSAQLAAPPLPNPPVAV